MHISELYLRLKIDFTSNLSKLLPTSFTLADHTLALKHTKALIFWTSLYIQRFPQEFSTIAFKWSISAPSEKTGFIIVTFRWRNQCTETWIRTFLTPSINIPSKIFQRSYTSTRLCYRSSFKAIRKWMRELVEEISSKKIELCTLIRREKSIIAQQWFRSSFADICPAKEKQT